MAAGGVRTVPPPIDNHSVPSDAGTTVPPPNEARDVPRLRGRGNVISVSSRFTPFLRWFVVSYALLNGLALVVFGLHGAFLLTTDPDSLTFGTGSGWALEQVWWHVVGGSFFTTAVFGIPILAVGLTTWAPATAWIGHPRTIAFGASVVVTGFAFSIAGMRGLDWLGVVALLAVSFAVLVPVPPSPGAVTPARPLG